MGLREENDDLRRRLSDALSTIAALCLKSDQPLQLSQIDLFRADGATIATEPDGKGGILIAAIYKEERKETVGIHVIQELANKDEMPAASIVQDFYETEQVEPSLKDRWEIVPDHLLADLDVPGYPDICPYKAWHVVTITGIWMIYTWYEGTGLDDDVWLYDKIEGKRLEVERVAYDFRDAMEKIQNIGRE